MSCWKVCKYCRVLSRIWQPAEFCSSQNECGRLFFSLNYFVSKLTWFVQVRCDILYAYKSPFFWKLIKSLNLTPPPPRPQIPNSLNWIFGTIWFYIFFLGWTPQEVPTSVPHFPHPLCCFVFYWKLFHDIFYLYF